MHRNSILRTRWPCFLRNCVNADISFGKSCWAMILLSNGSSELASAGHRSWIGPLIVLIFRNPAGKLSAVEYRQSTETSNTRSSVSFGGSKDRLRGTGQCKRRTRSEANRVSAFTNGRRSNPIKFDGRPQTREVRIRQEQRRVKTSRRISCGRLPVRTMDGFA